MELARPEQLQRCLGSMTMIDHPGQVERLMERLGTALPIPARLTPEVQIRFANNNAESPCRQTAA